MRWQAWRLVRRERRLLYEAVERIFVQVALVRQMRPDSNQVRRSRGFGRFVIRREQYAPGYRVPKNPVIILREFSRFEAEIDEQFPKRLVRELWH
jgi:hypothetical protein